MPADRLTFVCPACKGPLADLRCALCARTYPVICGIPDFRLWPDPYISIEADREKAGRLAALDLPFEALVDRYYAMTPEVPRDAAARWMARTAHEVNVARAIAFPADLDLGCSTGAALIASGGGVGVDVALRWLVIARARLREAGVSATLVCANAEALPFENAAFTSLYAGDLLEHLRDAPAAIAESRRVLRDGAPALWTTNNRWSLAPEPHVGLCGVGWLPRSLQAQYVAMRRPSIHPYRITLRSAREAAELFAEFREVSIEPAPLIAPHRPDLPLDRYNRAIRWPVIAALAARVGPRLWIRCRR